jgi:hypothetical protein
MLFYHLRLREQSKHQWIALRQKITLCPLVFSLTPLVGCTGTIMTLDTLKADGYQRSSLSALSSTGKPYEEPNYELWWKEKQEKNGCIIHLCLRPKIDSDLGYNWRVIVVINDKETWGYESGWLDRAGWHQTRRGIDCTVSPLLPKGRVHFQVGIVYYVTG